MVLPFAPKLIPFEFDSTTSPVVTRVVPAETDWIPGCVVCVGPEMVTEFAFCESVMLFPPARTTVPVEIFAVAPAVLPEMRAVIWG
jgi:hypothetical protein